MRDTFKELGIDEVRLAKTSALICAEMFFAGAPFAILYTVLDAIFSNPIPTGRLIFLLGMLVISFALQAMFSVSGHINASLFAFRTGGDLRLRLGECLRRLPLGYFQTRSAGSLAETFLFDVSAVETTISHLYTKFIGSITLPCIIAAILLVIDWRLALTVLITLPPAFLFMLSFKRLISRASEKHLDSRRKFADTLLEYIQGIATFKSYNILGKQAGRLDKALKSFCAQSIGFENLTAPMVFIYSMILDLGFPLLLLTSYFLLEAGTLSGAVMILFIVVCLRFYEPLHNVSLYYAMLRHTSGAIRNITEILGQKPMPGTEEPDFSQGVAVSFQNVSFGYGDREVLQDISFNVAPYSMTALVGPSGAGKTTVANLLCRFWDPQSGKITLNGVDLRTISPEYMASGTASVMQEVTLFNDTIYNNIKAGDLNASDEMIFTAAKRAQCAEFIAALPEGYETVIGENGSMLSGGERQRVSIARALLKNSPIAILDEATASLDTDNEYHVQKALESLVTSRTVLVIAHRLSTIVHADQILFIENGGIAQKGTFEQLISTPGRFKEFWDCQQKASQWKLQAGGEKDGKAFHGENIQETS